MRAAFFASDLEAEDVVQDTYVRALTGLEGFRGDSALGTWLARIAINEALGRLRRKMPEALDAPPAAPVVDPESLMATAESRVMLERAIDELPDAFRSVFVARMVEGMSVEETAELFGLRPETVKTRVHRARVRLRATPRIATRARGARVVRLRRRPVRSADRRGDPAASPAGLTRREPFSPPASNCQSLAVGQMPAATAGRRP